MHEAPGWRHDVVGGLRAEDEKIDCFRLEFRLSEKTLRRRYSQVRGTLIRRRDVTLRDASLGQDFGGTQIAEIRRKIFFRKRRRGQVIANRLDRSFFHRRAVSIPSANRLKGNRRSAS